VCFFQCRDLVYWPTWVGMRPSLWNLLNPNLLKRQLLLYFICFFISFNPQPVIAFLFWGSNIATVCSQYFHPDNMSSAEKMKIELAKVRDEFKMSESDCGSARVQSKGICSLVFFWWIRFGRKGLGLHCLSICYVGLRENIEVADVYDKVNRHLLGN